MKCCSPLGRACLKLVMAAQLERLIFVWLTVKSEEKKKKQSSYPFFNLGVMSTRRLSVDVGIAVQMYLYSRRLSLFIDCLPCQNVSVKPGWKVNGTRLLGSLQRKISGSNETTEKVACFSGWNIPNRNSCSIALKPSLVPVSGLRGRFSVNGTDLYKW